MPVYVLFCNYCATILQRQNELSIHAPGGAPLMSRRAYLERLIGRAPDLTERAPSAAISVRTTSATGTPRVAVIQSRTTGPLAVSTRLSGWKSPCHN